MTTLPTIKCPSCRKLNRPPQEATPTSDPTAPDASDASDASGGTPSAASLTAADMPPCTRCGCELAPLAQLHMTAATHLQRAWHHLRAQDLAAATTALELSWTTHKTSDSIDLGLILSTLSADPITLHRWTTRAQLMPSS